MKYCSFLLIVLFTLVACDSAPMKEQSEPVKVATDTDKIAVVEASQAKYGFSYLNSVKVVSNFRLHSWQALDRKSLIVRDRGGKSYLLTLSKVDVDLLKSQNILLGKKTTLATSHLQSGVSKVRVTTNLSRSGSVNGIYELVSAEQEIRVKRQVLGENYVKVIPPEYKNKNEN